LKNTLEKIYFNNFFGDYKKFLNTNSSFFLPQSVISVGIHFKEKMCGENTTQISFKNLFQELANTWISNIQQEYEELIKMLIKDETWECLENSFHSNSVQVLVDRCISDSSFAKKIEELLELENIVTIVRNGIRQSAKIYLEHMYNLFTQQFPQEQHPILHDIYIQMNYKITNTGIPLNYTRGKIKRKSMKIKNEKTGGTPLDEDKLYIKIWNPNIFLSTKKLSKFKKN